MIESPADGLVEGRQDLRVGLVVEGSLVVSMGHAVDSGFESLLQRLMLLKLVVPGLRRPGNQSHVIVTVQLFL